MNVVLFKGGKWKLATANIQCIFFCAITSFFITGWAFGYALTSLQVDEGLVFERQIKAPFIGGTSGFGTIGIMTVSLAWMDLAMRGKSLSSKTSGAIKKAQLAVRCIAVSFGLIEATLMVLNLTALAGMLSLLAMVIIIPS